MTDLTVISTIRAELTQNIDANTRDTAQRFFKEGITVYGVKTATVEKIAAGYFSQIKNLPKEQIFASCEELLKSDYMEESFIAFEWAYRVRAKYERNDFAVFESWIVKYVNNWAKCDTLCNHTVGSFIEMFPACLVNLKRWTGSENRWLRRAAAVSLVLPARKGLFLKDIFEISDRLLTDKDDLVQKGYGWMLKEASKAHQQEVFDYIIRNKQVMPRTALRYAIEKMPEDLKRQAMARA